MLVEVGVEDARMAAKLIPSTAVTAVDISWLSWVATSPKCWQPHLKFDIEAARKGGRL